MELKKLLNLVLITGLLVRLVIAFSIEYSIAHGISSDDSYYYFRIAQNISNGFGSTFDQINPTNGYQPLVLWFLVLIYKIAGSDIFLPVILSQVILSLISTLAAYLTFKFVRKISGDEFDALLSVILIFLNPVIIAINFKSLETNFYWLFLILSFMFYDKYLKNYVSRDNYWQYFLFGVLISIAAFSRLDGGFYILALSIYLLFFIKEAFIEKVKKIFFSGLGFSIFFVPYLMYNYLTFGNAVPISGRAKVFHNHRLVLSQVGDYFSTKFFLYEIRRFLFPFNFDLFANRGFGIFEQIAVYVVIAVFVFLIVLFIKSGYFKQVIFSWKGFGFLVIFLFFHYSFYTLYFWEYRFYYFLPEYLIIVMIFSLLVSKWIENKFQKNQKKSFTTILVIIVLIFIVGGVKIFSAQHEQTLPLKAAKWIKENIDREKILASANSGILSYFTQMRVVNLDGMVNNDELLEAFKGGEKKYLEYLKEKKIEYLVDYFLSDKPENKYYFPEILNDKYEVIKVFTDSRLKYQKLNHMLVIKLNLYNGKNDFNE